MQGFTADPPGLAEIATEATCVRYGRLPATPKSYREALRLQRSRLYRVEITALAEGKAGGDDGTSTQGYELRFCVGPSARGVDEVRSVLWDEGGQRWRAEVCAK